MIPLRRLALAAVLAVLVAAVLGGLLYYGGAPRSGGSSNVKDFTIIASIDGFNESALAPYSVDGVQQTPWPVIQVARGTVVNITVYNEDQQTHSFQIAHYFDSGIQTIAPGQKLTISFTANETGTFSMRCVIPCSIHWAMQDGALVVT